ncbi:hypothetical protein SDC9_199045 [bioreactor metagenome]|uniref:Uncharacterized protein n=1 Tax=bioreactor metagenome TaxID=1076179 RepID=A0A645IJT8_9ZZZZ
MLESVVRDGDLRSQRGEQLHSLDAVAGYYHLGIRQPFREHQRLVAGEIAAGALGVLPDPERRVFLRAIAPAHEPRLDPRLGELAHDIFGHRGLIRAAETVVADADSRQHRVRDGENSAVE